MAKQVAEPVKMGLGERVQEFVQDVKTEMSKVAWPSKDDLRQSTSVVFILLGISGAIVAVLDFFFQNIVLLLLRLG